MFEEYWEAPERLWRQDIGEEEADAITVRAFAAAFLLGYASSLGFFVCRLEVLRCIRRMTNEVEYCRGVGL